MATPGCFTQVVNKGKLDKLIMAPELLTSRVEQIVCKNKKAMKVGGDLLPTLVDIEKTHILYVNAHFKPFVELSNEYIKCEAIGATHNWDTEILFNIPMSGEFFSDPVLYAKIEAAACGTSGTLPAFPSAPSNDYTAGNPSEAAKAATYFKDDTDGNGDGSFTYLTYQYVKSDGTVLDRTGTSFQNFIRYIEYPGERFLAKAQFKVSQNPIDEYLPDDVVMYRIFRILPHKLNGWKKLMGQQLPIKGYSELSTIKDVSAWPSEHTGIDTLVAPAASSETSVREYTLYNGPQTPKVQQPILDMWIPILFWFADPKICVPSVSIPLGQRHIWLTLNKYENMLYAAPGDFKLRLITEVVGVANNLFSNTYKSYMTEQPVMATNSDVVKPAVASLTLYINNYFISAYIHDIYLKRISFNLIRVRRHHKYTINTDEGNNKLESFKLAVETIYFGFKPQINETKPTYAVNGIGVTAGNKNIWKDWHRYSKYTDNYSYIKSFSQTPFLTATNGDDVGVNTFKNEVTMRAQSLTQTEKIVYPVSTDVVDKIGIESHGNDLYKIIDKGFFNKYLPYQFGCNTIVCPEDDGVFAVNWCLYPGSYQPSGHFNLSRARDTKILWKSSYISTSTPADLHASAIIINFSLISDGSMILRFGG